MPSEVCGKSERRCTYRGGQAFVCMYALICLRVLSAIRSLLSKMVRAADQGKEEMRFSMLWLVSYCFLLRLPSEVRLGWCCLLGTLVCVQLLRQALPMRKCEPDSEIAKTSQSIIWRVGDEICLRLLRRKNRQSGSRDIFCIGCDALGLCLS